MATQLRRIARIGQGQFGVVDVVEGSERGERGEPVLYAVKTLQKAKLRRAKKAVDVWLEREVHQRASLAAASGGTAWIPSLFRCSQSPSSISLVLGYAPCGTLWDLFAGSAPFSPDGSALPSLDERTLRWYLAQLALAVQWAHEEARVVHRDLKAQNLLIGPGGRLLLTDFGSAARLLPGSAGGDDAAKKTTTTTTARRARTRSDADGLCAWSAPRYVARADCAQPHGTADYIAPEVLAVYEATLLEAMAGGAEAGAGGGEGAAEGIGATGYDASVDWWSAGAMAYELAYGAAPFWAEDIGETYRRITHSEDHLTFPAHPARTPAFRDLLRACLAPAPRRIGRLGPAEVLRHAWFAQADWVGIRRGRPAEGEGVQIPPEVDLACVDGNGEGLSWSVEDWEELTDGEGETEAETTTTTTTMTGWSGGASDVGNSTFVRAARGAGAAHPPLWRNDAWAGWDWCADGVVDLAPRSTTWPTARGPFATPRPRPGPDTGADAESTPRPHPPAPPSAPRTLLRTARKTPHSDRPLSAQRALRLIRTCARESVRRRASGGVAEGEREGGAASDEARAGGTKHRGTLHQRLLHARAEMKRAQEQGGIDGFSSPPARADDSAYAALCGRYESLAKDLRSLETRESQLRLHLDAAVAAVPGR